MKMKITIWGFAASLALLGVIFGSKPASASTFNQVLVFGDSTVDTGWFRYKPLPNTQPLHDLAAASLADGGRIPDTPYGLGAAQILAAHFGLFANPADNGAGGTNYAASGAQNNANFTNPSAPSTVSQINTYLSTHGGSANSNALYLFSSGGNDIKYAKTLSGTSNQTAWVAGAASAAATALSQLQTAGAHSIIVSNGYVANSTGVIGTLTSTYYNDLFADLTTDNVHFIKADFQSVQQAIFANPSAYGFTSISNVDGPNGTALINPDPALILNSWALYGTTALLRSPNAAQTSFWADDEHLAAAAQQIEGNFLFSVATPLPAALPLFATGLGVMALLTRRRKRKNADALVAA